MIFNLNLIDNCLSFTLDQFLGCHNHAVTSKYALIALSHILLVVNEFSDLYLPPTGWSFIGGSGWLVPGRLMTGLSAGIVSAPVSVLVAEISAPKLRAHLTVYKHTAFSLGLFIMYCFGLMFKVGYPIRYLYVLEVTM